MLTGSYLLSKAKDLVNVSKPDLTTACSCVTVKKDGGQRVNFTAFHDALPSAKDVELGAGTAGISTGGRKLSYTAKVQSNDDLLVGKAYTAMLEVNPGDEFDTTSSAEKPFA